MHALERTPQELAGQSPEQGSPNSDVDLLVVVSESDLTAPRRAARAYGCLREVPIPLDILVRTREEVERTRHVPASLINEILERGQVLYR